jgi:hypothetical protein
MFQQALGLDSTGDLTQETIDSMEVARCGVPDVDLVAAQEMSGGEVSNFVLRGCNYTRRTLTYRFTNGTGDIAGTAERAAVRNAFDSWASVLCGVTFVERASGPVDFPIGWHSGDHSDGYPFDGVGNTLAHAFFPPPCGGGNSGSMHFDDAETWSTTGTGGTFDLETVALHEIGHLLGLSHSSVPGSVMFPTYGGNRRALTQDDIDGIRRLYPYLGRRGDSGQQAGFVGEIDSIKHRNRQIITATRSQTGRMKLIAWRVYVNGNIRRTGDSGGQAGRASSISIAKNPTSPRYVTAYRTSSGKLKLINWSVNFTGTNIRRRGNSGGLTERASMIKIVAVAPDRFVTAFRTSTRNLKLIGWRLRSNGSLTRLADSGNQAGYASEIDMVTLPGSRVVTAVRTRERALQIITWEVGDSAISRLGDSADQGESARHIRLALDAFDHPVAAIRQDDGALKLIAWRVGATGALHRLGDSDGQAGETKGHDISMASGQIVTAMKSGDGNLKVIVWDTDAGGSIKRVGDSDGLAGSASLINLTTELSGNAPIVTSARTISSSLKLISWSTA